MKHNLREIFITAWKLGWTSFGGPTAHIGYFQKEYVENKKWLDPKRYTELTALCQLLPGPTSSQVGMGIGYLRGGVMGAIASWIGFTLPSALIMIAFALFVQKFTQPAWFQGFLCLAAAVITQAVYTMGKQMVQTPTEATIFTVATSILLLWPHPFAPLVVLLLSGLVGKLLFSSKQNSVLNQPIQLWTRQSLLFLILFFALTVFLPLLATFIPSIWLFLLDTFYRSGSLVFGGGHVVLPLLEHEIVQTNHLSSELFFTGYGVAQALPGPLFTFSAYVGTLLAGIPGGIIATIAVFLPSFFLLFGIMPLWEQIRQHPAIQPALKGIHAAVVGILFSALIQLVQSEAIRHTYDLILYLFTFLLIHFWQWKIWKVLLFTVSGAYLVSLL